MSAPTSDHKDTPSPTPTPTPAPTPSPDCAVTLFGPERFIRTAGPKSKFERHFTKPASIAAPFSLVVENGSPTGSNRVSSAEIELNEVRVAAPSDFGRRTSGFTRAVDVRANNDLHVELASAPASYLTIRVCAASGDHVAPTLLWTAPADGSYVSTATPRLAVRYQDTGSRGETVSGVDLASLEVLVNGIDRTALFSKGTDEAVADLTNATALAPGVNGVVARVKDRAGNQAMATSSFKVDVQPPSITISQPAIGDATGASALTVTGQVVDASPVNVKVFGAGGIEIGAVVSGGEACVADAACVFDFTAPNVPLGDGPSATLRVVVTDAAGNVGSAETTVTVDRVPPVVAITSPAAGAYAAGGIVHVTGTVNDGTGTTMEVNGMAAMCNGTPFCPAGGGTFLVDIPVASEGSFTIDALARDAAGNVGTASVQLIADSVPPQIVVTAPADGFVTRAPTITASATVTDSAAVRVTINGQSAAAQGDGRYQVVVPISEGSTAIAVSATDAAGNASVAEVHGIVDRAPPVLTVAAPSASAVVGMLPLLVQGAVTDATATTVTVDGQPATVAGSAWQASIAALAEGEHALAVRAVDAAGNETEATVTVVVDLGPPVVSIVGPANGFLTRQTTVDVEPKVSDRSATSVVVAGLPASCAPDGACSPVRVSLVEGDNAIAVVATDATGRSTTATVSVTRDSIAPTLDLQAPETISRGRPASASAAADDALGVATVTITTACVAPAVCAGTSATFTGPPYTVPLAVPDGIGGGATIAVTATASDRAGNETTTSRGVRVTSDGVVAGQVLADTTGLPLEGVHVSLAGDSASEPVTTDASGRYSIPTTELSAVVLVVKDGFTTAERSLTVSSGSGSVPVDARLTPLAVETTSDGAVPIVAGAWSLALPAGTARATPLTAQGLPGLLPLGFSPIAALDLQVAGGVTSPVIARITLGAGALSIVHLVRYATASHEWRMVAPALAPGADGTVTATVFEAGTYALVVADPGDPPIAIPHGGEPLEGIALVPVPAGATSTGQVDPAVIPPTGGTAQGTLRVQSPQPLPSGTVVSAQVTETYSLTSGEQASSETRAQDVIVYGARCDAGSLCATFPITPSRSYSTAELASGRVHLDILSGRDGVRGTVAGSEAVTLDAGTARLQLPSHALAEDTAVVLEQHPLSAFLPSVSNLVALDEVVVDFSGKTLQLAAELSTSAASASAGDTFLVARVERLDGVPRLQVAAVAQVVGDRIVTRPYPGLPGVTREGRYVFYRSPAPVGFIAGVASSTAGPVKALVETAGLPFVGLGKVDGSFIVAAATGGGVGATARVPGTSLIATATANVSANETTALNLLLQGAVTQATVVPADGAQAVAPNATLEIATPVALNAASAVTANVQLFKGDAANGVSIAVRLVLSVSGKSLSVVPAQPLDYGTTYTLSAAGLLDVYGGLVAGAASMFRTKDFVAPRYDLADIQFSMPSADGIVTVGAPPNALPPGTTVLIINESSGFVATFTAENDGALGKLVPAELPATTSDVLMVTVTDPQGNTVTFTRSKFVNPQTGETAIGPGGGTVTAADGSGVELRIPDGALDRGATFKIESVSPAQLEQLFPGQKPDFGDDANGNPQALLAAGLKVESPDKPSLKKEAKLAFPLPQSVVDKATALGLQPKDAFFYVFRRLRNGDDKAVFEVMDIAFIEGDGATAKVVTASYPHPGFVDSAGDVNGAAVTTNYMFLMATISELLPGQPTPGAITGTVRKAEWTPATPSGPGPLKFQPVPGAVVAGVDAAGTPLIAVGANAFVARTNSEGLFTLWDLRYTGGTVRVAATLPDTPLPNAAVGDVCANPPYGTSCGTAFEAAPGDWSTSSLRFFRSKATVNITFPADAPPLGPAAIDIQVKKVVNGQRASTGGIVSVGTPLIFELAISGGFSSAQVQGRSYGARQDDTQPIDPERNHYTLNIDDFADGFYRPAEPGTYTVSATATRISEPNTARTSSITFRVIAVGGTRETSVSGPPGVVTEQTLPVANDVGVPVTAFPQIVFSEPVKNVPGNITLTDDAGAAVSFALLGVAPGGTQLVDVTSADVVVTSVTLQPLLGLRYNTTYTLRVLAGITDTDSPTVHALSPAPYVTSFKTFGPEGMPGSAQQTGSSGLVVLENRAYLTRTNAFVNGSLEGYDLDNPVEPKKLAEEETFAPRPFDIAGEVVSGLQKVVAIATGPTTQAKPATVIFYDVGEDTDFQWLGAASVVNTAFDGFISRITMLNGFVYTATVRRGIQVVDLSEARRVWDDLATQPNPALARQNARTAINTDGQGFGQTAVVNTIPLRKSPRGTDYYLNDIKVMGIGTQNIVAVTGELGLAVADPLFAAPLYQGRPEKTEALPGGGQRTIRFEWGQAVALGRLQNRDVAVLVGTGSIDEVPKVLLVTIGLASPEQPQLLGYVDLGPDLNGLGPVDVILKDTTALVGLQNSTGSQGAVLLVSLADILNPTRSGVIPSGPDALIGGRLALMDTGLLLSTARMALGGTTPLGGVRTAAFDTVGAVLAPNPVLAKFVPDSDLKREQTLGDARLELRVYPSSQKVSNATLDLFQGAAPYQMQIPITLQQGVGSYTIAKGLEKAVKDDVTAKLSFITRGQLVGSVPRIVPITSIRLTLDSNNDTIVEDKDDDDVLADANKNDPEKAMRFVFWEGDTRLRPQDAFVDFATVRLRLTANAPTDERIGLFLPGADWELRVKAKPRSSAAASCVATGNAHLCDGATAADQAGLLQGPLGEPSPGPSLGGLVELPPALLRGGDNEFLFRCRARSDDAPACGAATTMQLVRMLPTTRETLAERRIMIRPFRMLSSIMSARGSMTFDSQPTAPYFKVIPELVRDPAWNDGDVRVIPAGAKRVTLIVHGANVSHGEFRAVQRFEDTSGGCSDDPINHNCHPYLPSWFGQWAKRLYWASHPILEAQKAYVVGISWPGDRAGVLREIYFPEEEFSALQSGLPLGKYVKKLRERGGIEQVNILAHSMGNIVVNNALKEVPSAGAPVRYVMNASAVPSEAFLAEYNPAAPSNALGVGQLVTHAQTLGYPDPDHGHAADWIWADQEKEVEDQRRDNNCPTVSTPPLRDWPLLSTSSTCSADPPTTLPPDCKCDLVTLYGRSREEVNPEFDPLYGSVPGHISTPFFRERWSRLPKNTDGTLQGAWTQFFRANVNGQDVSIFNTFNTKDGLLRIDQGRGFPGVWPFRAWLTAQVNGKPFAGLGWSIPREANDSVTEQRWWTLAVQNRSNAWASTASAGTDQDELWGDIAPLGGATRLGRTRQWAELAMWYPALSPPAGVGPIDALAERNLDFSSIGGEGSESLGSYLSHSYLYAFQPHEVFSAYRTIKHLFEP